MRLKKEDFFAILIILFGIIFLIQGIFAAPAPPTNLILENAPNPNYDNGVFSVNWSSGGGDSETEYWVYVFSNEVFYMVGPNSSNTGFAVNNPAEAKYTFIIEALNGTPGVAGRANSTTNISISIDSSGPLITVVGYTDRTLKKNTDNLELGIFVEDALSGLENSYCVIGIVNLNYTLPVSNNWCNSTSIPLTGITDGNKSIKILVNDSAGSWGFNNDYYVWMDSTGPSLSFECFPNPVILGEEITCQCNASDSGSGVNYTEFSENPSTDELGTFSRTCNSFDILGNSNSIITSYTVISGSIYDGTNEQNDEPAQGDVGWIYSYHISESEFEEGYNQLIALNRRIVFNVSSQEHHVGVLELNETHVKVQVASTPLEKILGIGDSFKVDVLNDGFYDVLIFLNGILNNNSANLSVEKIHESLDGSGEVLSNSNEEDLSEFESQEDLVGGDEGSSIIDAVKEILGKLKWWIWVLILVGLIGLFLGIHFAFRKKPLKIKEGQEYVGIQPKEGYDGNPQIGEGGEVKPLKDTSKDNEISKSGKIFDESKINDSSGVNENFGQAPSSSGDSGKNPVSISALDDILSSHPDPETKPRGQLDALNDTLTSSKKSFKSKPDTPLEDNKKNLPVYKPQPIQKRPPVRTTSKQPNTNSRKINSRKS